MTLDLEAQLRKPRDCPCEPEDPCLGWALTLARVAELEAAIHRECTKCFGTDCDVPTCPLHPYRGGE